MSKHMTIINLACTITKLRKWGEAWKHSAESAQAATAQMHQAHEAKMVEHRAAFGARTEADAKIIAGLRSEIDAARMAVLERDSLISERDGLLTQVQNMRAEMQRLSAQLDWERAEIKRLQWENLTMHKDAEDGYAEAIKVLGDPIALSKERDALRAEVDFLKTLRPKYKVGDKLESYSKSMGLAIPVTVVGVRTVYDCQTDGAEYPVGHSEDELKERYEQTPKHPVKVGEWVRRLVPSPACDVGTVAKVVHVDDDTSEIEYDVKRIDGQHGVWFAKNCEPCDPPIVKREPTIGDTVRLVKIPIMGAVSPELQRVLEWPWIERWGTLNQTALVVEPAYQLDGTLSVCLSTNVHARWPISCVEVVTEATHDTEAGKAVAESAVSETVAEEIKVWDVVEVYQATGKHTAQNDVGFIGTVGTIHLADRVAHVRSGLGMPHMVDLCDVRKVRKVTT